MLVSCQVLRPISLSPRPAPPLWQVSPGASLNQPPLLLLPPLSLQIACWRPVSNGRQGTVWQHRSELTLHPCYPGSFPPLPPQPAASTLGALRPQRGRRWDRLRNVDSRRPRRRERPRWPRCRELHMPGSCQVLALCAQARRAAAVPAGLAAWGPGLPGEHAGSGEAAPPKKAQSRP